MMNKKVLLALVSTFLVLMFVMFLFRAARPGKMISSETPQVKRPAQDEVSGLMAKGDYAGAIKLLNETVEKNPDSKAAERALYSLASIYGTRGELLREKEVYETILKRFASSDDVSKAQTELERVNMAMLFSPVQDPDSFTYEIKSGDSLSKIAKKFDTTVDLLLKTNGLKDGAIKSGRRLKVTKHKFSISVDKSQNILTLKGDGRVLKTYKVATGINNSTPVGSFKIINKVVDPVWYTQQAAVPTGSPKNILGSRWMGISEPHYGIHGSTDPASIGMQATAGCVRMHNGDVEELYAAVPVGTEVVI